MIDKIYMERCLELAGKGFPSVFPNPMAGCVIVHDNKIIGEGFHREFGKAHAEVNAIHSVKNKELLQDSILYVNLEPCSHHGKTPPCADLIMEYKIPKVIIASSDPNPEVNGKGVERLKRNGIQVETYILQQEAIELNKRFYTFHLFKRPYIILKFAQCQNGFMAGKKDEQQWISNNISRLLVHKWRSEEQSILVGTNTARIDNPRLNNRFNIRPSPLRIVLDERLALSKDLNLFDKSVKTLVVNSILSKTEENKEYLQLKFDQSLLHALMHQLYQRNVQSLIVEGGAHTLNSFIHQNLWDEARIFTGDVRLPDGIKAPEIVGTNILQKKISRDILAVYRNKENENKLYQ